MTYFFFNIHTDPTDPTDFKFAPSVEVIVSSVRFAEKDLLLRRKVIEFNSLRSSKKFFKINDVPKTEAYRLSQG